MKYKTLILIAIALFFLVAAFLTFRDDMMSPYVSFKEARTRNGQPVQVIGSRKRSAPVIHEENGFSFTLIDKGGETMQFVHSGPKPANFEHSEQVVVLGRYDADARRFVADKVLVKCPSKYRRMEI